MSSEEKKAYDRKRNAIRRKDPIYIKKHRDLQIKWIGKNRDKINKKRREQRIKKPVTRKTKEELAQKARLRNIKYYQSHRLAIYTKRKERLKLDIQYRLKRRLRYRLWCALKGFTKHKSTMQLLGCSLPQFKEHLEKQFNEGMNWNNYGRGGWVIDHIKPFASFDLNNSQQIEIVCHYSNLQPLWEQANLLKGSKIL